MGFAILSLDDARWRSLIASHPDATAFHHPAWTAFLAECYGYRPFLATLSSRADELDAGLPMLDVSSRLTGRRWIGLPFTDYCFPLTRTPEDLSLLTQALADLRERERLPRIEVRGKLPAHSNLFHTTPFVLHVLNLDTDPAEAFSRFSKKCRQYVRKAEKREGLRLLAAGDGDMKTFYRLHVQTHARLGVPVQPKRFFRLLWTRILAAGHGVALFVADAHDVPVAAAVVLHHGRRAMIKYSASDPAFLAGRCHYFLFWKCIEWACSAGMTQLDFGRSTVTAEGLRRFKSGWGAAEYPLTYSFLGRSPRHAQARLSSALQPILRRAPAWVTRIIGELLYRHVA